jgi:predicted transglutaminase-like cysteine proteinase
MLGLWIMRALALALMAVCTMAAAVSLPAPEFAHIDDSHIEIIAQTVGQDEPRRELIRGRLTGWVRMLESPQTRALDDRAKLQRVNDYVNETPFQCDAAQWCVEDYWATPIEFLANHGGDCEDFAIAKYFALRALNIADDRLRLVYAKIRRGSIAGTHVVLAYYPATDAEPLILDVLDKNLLPASQRDDLTPLLSFNAKDIRAERQSSVPVGAVALQRWGDTWRAAKNDQSIRFLTPAQRDAPQCRRLRARAAWCT